MVNYEVSFIIDPTLDDDKKDAAIERVKEVISSEGEVGDVDVWGLRRLAYPIQKKNEGYYVVMTFKAEPTLPQELDRRFRISDDFMRHMIIVKDEKELEKAKAAREAAAKKAEEEAKKRAEEAARKAEEEAKAAAEAEAEEAEEAPVSEADVETEAEAEVAEAEVQAEAEETAEVVEAE